MRLRAWSAWSCPRRRGACCARALRADRDQPAFARSARDGFACRAEEAGRHEPLRVAGSTRAGQPPPGPLPPRAAWEIMTGAPVPEGADAVMMVEHVETADGSARLQRPRTLKAGENIVTRGAQARAGDELLPAGTAMGAGQIALAAACGISAPDVYARPRVAIISTGDELVPVDREPGPGRFGIRVARCLQRRWPTRVASPGFCPLPRTMRRRSTRCWRRRRWPRQEPIWCW